MKKAYFLSDLHLGASYLEDSRDRERKVVAFLDSVRDDVGELYLLGDILDYWFEYRYVVPRGYVRFFGKLAELSDAGVKITWLIGNHDIWIFDYIPSELGVEVVDGVLERDVMGARMVMTHGDGVGHNDLRFRFLRAFFRNRVCQKLYSGVHPRWTVPFASAWSSSSRKGGMQRDRSQEISRNIEALARWSEDYSLRHPGVGYYLFGHLHVVERRKLPCGAEMVVLGDWLTHFSYATFDGTDFRMHVYGS
ncbi:MAG: UDP-2,3-diacylglucosamine diphosphatase [Bacteroides sp.]|nr:UDP-2,3-diacylglucosamine diphosphatase [Bacteroides sp.]